jgi:lipopolysaccharide transport system ATP-binding protein
MTKAEIRSKFDEIVDFSGVERYIDTPVKRYSSGMYVRLAFAVAAFLEPEILIVDEVLAVGDAEFQKKCLGRMKDVSVNDGRTVLFVSHDLNAVSQLCTHSVLLKQGSVWRDGKTSEIVSEYLSQDNRSASYQNLNAHLTDKVAISTIQVENLNGELSSSFYYNEEIIIHFTFFIKNLSSNPDLFVMILDSRKKRIFACEVEYIKEDLKLVIEGCLLVRGEYSIHTFINVPKIEQLDVAEDVCHFKIIDSGSSMSKHGEYDYGSVFGKYRWI